MPAPNTMAQPLNANAHDWRSSFEIERPTIDGRGAMAAPRVGLSLGVAPEHASPADEQHYPPAAGFPIPDVTHKEEAEEDRECDTSSIGADEAGSGAVHGGGHGGATRLAGLRYTVTEVPPWHVCIILGFQVRADA